MASPVLSDLQTDTPLTSLTSISTVSSMVETDPITIYVTSTETTATSSTLISSQITDVPSSISSKATVSTDASNASKATVSSDATSTPDRLGTGAKAGIGVGVSVGILLLGALVGYITVLRRRLKKASRENAPPAGPAMPPSGIPELGSEGQKYELMGDKAWKASPVGPHGRTHAHELES